MLRTALPQIVTATLPGPKAKEIIDRRAAAVPGAIRCAYPVAIETGEGAMIQDVDGNILMDWIGGVGVLNIGFSHPEIVEAVKAQADKYFHGMFNIVTHEGYVALAEKLAEMEKRRGESRKARAKTGMPVVSLVGYTNVGKSSLMNALCGPSVAEADMLFATLDPTSRKLVLPSGMAVLLVDTVGFVSRLPHNLVEAFKSTLEEAAWSDVIVRVADAGDEQREEQLAVTDEVLDGLDCTDIPRLTVYNKCDKPNTLSFDPDILLTSAKTGYGLDKLLQKLDEVLSDRVHTIRVLLPYDKLGLAAPMRERGSVQVEEYREDGLYLEGIVKTEDLHCFEGYLV